MKKITPPVKMAIKAQITSILWKVLYEMLIRIVKHPFASSVDSIPKKWNENHARVKLSSIYLHSPPPSLLYTISNH